MSKRKTDSTQDVILITGLGDIFRHKFETQPGYVASHDTVEAWELDYNQQVLDESTGQYTQFLTEYSKKPIKIYKDRPALVGLSTKVLASREQDAEIAYSDTRRQKNSMLLWVGIIAVLFAVTMSIIALVQLKSHNTAAVISPLYLAYAIPALAPTLNRLRYRDKKAFDIDKEKGSIQEYDTKTAFCGIVVEKTRRLIYKWLDYSKIPNDSISRNFGGRDIHYLGLNLEGDLWAIEPPQEVKENDTPQDCYLALSYELEIRETIGLTGNPVEKIKIGIFIFFCFIEAILLFLIIPTIGGNTI